MTPELLRKVQALVKAAQPASESPKQVAEPGELSGMRPGSRSRRRDSVGEYARAV